MINEFFFFFLSYLMGAIPTGYWIAKSFFNVDLTQEGSGNIGATNMARVLGGGVKYFLLVFILDAAKAYFTLNIVDGHFYLSYQNNHVQNLLLICAALLLLGNAHSVFLRFKGGKGVATMIGIVAYLIPAMLLLFFVISWLLLLGVTRQVFIASIGATVMLTLAYGSLFFALDNLLLYFLIALCYWIMLRHKQNIKMFIYSRYR